MIEKYFEEVTNLRKKSKFLEINQIKLEMYVRLSCISND